MANINGITNSNTVDIKVNYVPTPTGDQNVDKNNQDIAIALNTVIIRQSAIEGAIAQIKAKVGI